MCIEIVWVLEFDIDANRSVRLREAALRKGPTHTYIHTYILE